MARCGHSEWLTLRIERSEIILLISDRLQTLVNGLPDPDTQRPSLFVLIGRTAKSSALQALTSEPDGRKFGYRRGRGSELHLHLGGPGIFHDGPVLVADGHLPYRALKRSKRKRPKTSQRDFRRSKSSPYPKEVTCPAKSVISG